MHHITPVLAPLNVSITSIKFCACHQSLQHCTSLSNCVLMPLELHYLTALNFNHWTHLQIRDTSAPFRVLEKCQDLCLRDRASTNNLVRPCTSFDFQPGSRIASFSGAAEYEESTCYLTREQAHPEGIGNLVLVPNSVHFTEVCLSCELHFI